MGQTTVKPVTLLNSMGDITRAGRASPFVHELFEDQSLNKQGPRFLK